MKHLPFFVCTDGSSGVAKDVIYAEIDIQILFHLSQSCFVPQVGKAIGKGEKLIGQRIEIMYEYTGVCTHAGLVGLAFQQKILSIRNGKIVRIKKGNAKDFEFERLNGYWVLKK